MGTKWGFEFIFGTEKGEHIWIYGGVNLGKTTWAKFLADTYRGVIYKWGLDDNSFCFSGT